MLGRKEARVKREELVELGYTVVPGVMQDPFLCEVRGWTDTVMDRVEVDQTFRYQGSDVQIMTPERWPVDREPTDRSIPDSFAERISDLSEAKRSRFQGVNRLY